MCVVLTALVSCRSPNARAENDNSAQRPTRVVTDDLGRQVTVPLDIKRIVSLAPSATESVFAIGAGDKLIGDTTYCNYPERAKSLAKVGDTMNPNMETIVALKPDLVLVSTASQIEGFTKTLDQNGIAVYVMNPRSLDEVVESINRLAEILGAQVEAQALSAKIDKRRIEIGDKVGTSLAEGASKEAYERRLGVKKVFVQISREPLFTIGKDSFLNQVIGEAGGKSVTADVETAFPKLSKETASALDPEVIILSDSEDNQAPNDAFKHSPAVKNGHVYKINADIISRPGPRLVDALEQIARDLHPDRF